MNSTDAPAIVVYGATGLVGGRVCAALDGSEVPFVVAGRTKHRLDKLAAVVGAAGVRVAGIDDHDALVRAFKGARVVINCAAPLKQVGKPVLDATLDVGAHYVDLGGEQSFVHELYEHHDAAARRARRAVVPGCGLNCAIGDWAAAWAAAHVCGVTDTGPLVRTTAPARTGEERPLDDVAVSYVFDNLVLSPGSQRAVFDHLHDRAVVWRRDRWEPTRPGADHRAVNVGIELGGIRDVVSFPGGDVITLPRHINAQLIQTFTSTTRSAVATRAMRLLSRAIPLVPRRATEMLATYEPSEDEYKRTRYAVVAQARRDFASAQIVVRGEDHYRASAHIAAWVAQQLATRTDGPIGMRAPSELFAPALALRELATTIGLEVEPSFAGS